MSRARVAIGVDIGGTKISAGVVDTDGRLLDRAELPSDIDDAPSVCRQIKALVDDLGVEGAAGIGIGAAGVVDYASGRYLFGPNTRLGEVNLAEMATEVVGLPALLDNDANCAAWAEHRFGVGRGCSHFICVTLGTGIGGGFVLDGRPYRGAHGGAAEIGHMLVDPNGPACGCGARGCWEQFASGTALERLAVVGLKDHPTSSLARVAERGEVVGEAVTAAAREQDAYAQQVVRTVGLWVGRGLGSLVNVVEPERIAIAGGVARDWDLFAPAAHEGLLERMEAPSKRPIPEVLAAELEHDAGIVGAALLVLDEVLDATDEISRRSAR